MKTYTKEELEKVLDAHRQWAVDNSKGERANLTNAYLKGAYLEGAYLKGANLTNANLTNANLKGAYLEGAYLKGAYLYGANLTNANLTNANLKGAYLEGAYLYGANLTNANLTNANLKGAYLKGANLKGAYLYGANLTNAYLYGANLTNAYLEGAYLYGANLTNANLTNANLKGRSVAPEKGAFTAFKKVRGLKSGSAVVELLIPAEAKRVSALVGRKCRASEAKVVSVVWADDEALKSEATFRATHDSGFLYVVGETVKAPLDEDRRVECTTGIHFFMEQGEAENY